MAIQPLSYFALPSSNTSGLRAGSVNSPVSGVGRVVRNILETARAAKENALQHAQNMEVANTQYAGKQSDPMLMQSAQDRLAALRSKVGAEEGVDYRHGLRTYQDPKTGKLFFSNAKADIKTGMADWEPWKIGNPMDPLDNMMREAMGGEGGGVDANIRSADEQQLDELLQRLEG